MHYFQQRYIRENLQFPALTGLMTIDLPNKGLLSGIEMRVWGYLPAGVANPDVWLHDRLTKIEVIVNGSQVVKSYDARQLLAMMLFKKTPHYSHDMKNVQAGSCEEYFYINLGRHFHDLEYMLDLGQVSDPEIRIEYNHAMIAANGWTKGTALDDDYRPYISVVCHMLRDTTLVPKGYIKTSEIHRVDNAPSLGYNLTVPRGPTYSNLYLQSWYYLNGLGNVLDHYEVNINSDDIIPIRTQITELLAAQVRMYGIQETTQKFQGTGNNPYPWPMEVGNQNGEVAPGFADLELMEYDLWGCAQPLGFRTVTTGLQVAGNALIRVTTRGSLPFAMAAIPLFNPWDSDTWIDTSVLGDFWVRIEETAGVKAGVMKLLGDEVVTKYVTPSWP